MAPAPQRSCNPCSSTAPGASLVPLARAAGAALEVQAAAAHVLVAEVAAALVGVAVLHVPIEVGHVGAVLHEYLPCLWLRTSCFFDFRFYPIG